LIPQAESKSRLPNLYQLAQICNEQTKQKSTNQQLQPTTATKDMEKRGGKSTDFRTIFAEKSIT
jgi:hypothetical protein